MLDGQATDLGKRLQTRHHGAQGPRNTGQGKLDAKPGMLEQERNNYTAYLNPIWLNIM